MIVLYPIFCYNKVCFKGTEGPCRAVGSESDCRSKGHDFNGHSLKKGCCQLLAKIYAIQYNTMQLFYCFISFHMRHSQNTFINMFNINTKNDISFSIMLNKRSI